MSNGKQNLPIQEHPGQTQPSSASVAVQEPTTLLALGAAAGAAAAAAAGAGAAAAGAAAAGAAGAGAAGAGAAGAGAAGSGAAREPTAHAASPEVEYRCKSSQPNGEEPLEQSSLPPSYDATMLESRRYGFYGDARSFPCEINLDDDATNGHAYAVMPSPRDFFPMGPQPKVGPRCCEIVCPACGEQVRTRVERSFTTRTNTWAIWLCAFGWICCGCLLPFILGGCRRVNHYCPKCQTFVGSYYPKNCF